MTSKDPREILLQIILAKIKAGSTEANDKEMRGWLKTCTVHHIYIYIIKSSFVDINYSSVMKLKSYNAS